MTESSRVSLIFLCCTLALVWFGVGCLAPLTPSEGMPSIVEVGVFFLLPLFLCASMYRLAEKVSEQIFVVLVALVILSFGGWLLSIQVLGTIR